MKRILIIISSLLLSFNLFSDEIDSLQNVLQKTKEPDKAEILNQLANAYLYIIPDSALYFSEQALENAEKYKNSFQIVISYKNLGRCQYMFQNLTDADLNFSIADSIISEQIQEKSTNELLSEKANILDWKGRVLEGEADFAAALETYQNALNIFEQIKDKEGMARVYNDIGYVHKALGNDSQALSYFQLVYNIHMELGNKEGIATALNNLGIMYDTMGKRDSALFFYSESIKINEELGNIQVVAYLYHNIGIVYEFNGQLKEALDYYQKSLELTDEIGDLYGSISTLSRIAIVYREKGAFEKAKSMLLNSLALADSIQSIDIKKDVLLELSITYEVSGDVVNALKYYKEHIQLKDSLYGSNMMEQIAELETKYASEKQAQQIKILEKDKKIQAEESKRKNIVLFAAFIILILMGALAVILFRALREKRKSNILLKTQNAEILNQKEEIKAQAEELEKINHELEKLSIVASETDNAVIIAGSDGIIQWVNKGFEKIYGYTLEEFTAERGHNIFDVSSEKDVKERFLTVLEDKKTISYESSSLSKEGNRIFMQTTVTPLLDAKNNINKLIIIDSDIRDLKLAQQEILKKNEEILAQNEEIKVQNEEIETQNKKITFQNQLIKGSIRYALNIQSAILPPKNLIDSHFDNFILYKPKDIVSGDFYWFANPTENTFFIATVDCTGHGVPGAFMSMISNMILNEIVNQKRIFSTKEILYNLKNSIESSLRQQETQNHDGLDIILCRIEKDKNKIIYSGAKLPMIIYRSKEKEIERTKGDISHIGGVYTKIQEAKFTEHETTYNKNDVMYLASDGYIDQNNYQRRRLGTQKLNSIIIANAEKSTAEQKEILEKELNNWQQESEQRDDITIIGIKF